MKKYNQYKNSGVEWLGEIPEHWEVKKVTHIFNKIGSGTTPTAGTPKYYDNGNINWLQTGDLNDGIIIETSKKITCKAINDFSALKQYPKESIVIAMYGATIGKLGYLNIETTTNQACCVLGNPNQYLSKFGFYSFMNAKTNIISMSYGGGQPNISQDLVKSLRLVVPPLSEQTAIANFLDDKTTKIDQAIAIKQNQIELLKERRQILIHKALTKGINSQAKLVDTNAEWIGKIPEHWNYLKVKNIFKLIIEPAPKDNDYELLSVYTEIGVKPRAELEERGNKASTTDGYWLVKKGDIIVNKLLAWMGAIGISDYDGVTSPAYDILRATKPIEGSFYHNLFRMPSCKFELKKHSRGIMDMRLRLYFDKFGDVRVPYPPIEEQKEIVNHINLISQKIDSAISLKEQEIEKLKEYKMSLIDGVVTGKIMVC